MRLLLVLALLASPAAARARAHSHSPSWRTTRQCRCDRYTDPHYSGYVPRTRPYRGGRVWRY